MRTTGKTRQSSQTSEDSSSVEYRSALLCLASPSLMFTTGVVLEWTRQGERQRYGTVQDRTEREGDYG